MWRLCRACRRMPRHRAPLRASALGVCAFGQYSDCWATTSATLRPPGRVIRPIRSGFACCHTQQLPAVRIALASSGAPRGAGGAGAAGAAEPEGVGRTLPPGNQLATVLAAHAALCATQASLGLIYLMQRAHKGNAAAFAFLYFSKSVARPLADRSCL